MAVCRLCSSEAELRDSHIIPRSFINRVKAGEPQLLRMNVGTATKPMLENANWNEKLLCGRCEKVLCDKYEATQLKFLRNGKIVQKHPDRVTFSSFNYEKFYLFWLSILWRASISSLPAFKVVDLGEEMNACLARMIDEERMSEGGVCISQLIKVGIVKILPTGGFTQDVLRKVLCSFYLKKEPGFVLYYLVLEGFMVCFCLTANMEMEMPKSFGRIKRTFNFRMPALRIDQDENLMEIFNKLISYAQENENWSK